MYFSKKEISLLAVLSISRIAPIQSGWVDPDTPKDKLTTTSLIDGTEYKLIMSDEFNVPGRTFKDGDDPAWTALDKSDDDSSAAGGGSLHFYNSTMITTTKQGLLEIRSVIDKTEWTHYDESKGEHVHVKKDFKSGMLQSWNKFCFTGGIVEVDIIVPGDPYIGGLWPAVWLLGNLGRATYEASTNNIWPWSFNKCDRKKQQAQSISACNEQNHYGLNHFQGRGATEIDIIEVMAGADDGPLPATVPPVGNPYADFTLQVAPGVTENRPHSGSQPSLKDIVTKSGTTKFLRDTWYDGLETNGNTTLNPFFYGTYLGVTKPSEPVTRNEKQTFQADAVGAMHQLTPSHFNTMHTVRLEWQPGPGGRLDWFTKDHRQNATYSMTTDGLGQDWVRAFTVKDESLNVTGAQIPVEPSYLIINTGISSTWGFPKDTPADCTKCFDCSNTTCACNFHPGFCNMMKDSNVAMYVDHVRVYQTQDHSAHVGEPHTVGCDPVGYPTREFIKGNEHRYMRAPPFSKNDKGPLKKRIYSGGGRCKHSSDCGGAGSSNSKIRGECMKDEYAQGFFNDPITESRCWCYMGFTGPFCLADVKMDDEPGAMEIRSMALSSLFDYLPTPALPTGLILYFSILVIGTVVYGFMQVLTEKRENRMKQESYSSVPLEEE